MCLLHMLVEHGGYDLIVVHVDHGIREDSSNDTKLVEALAQKYNLPFIATKLHLTKDASEQQARDYRYSFLFKQIASNGAIAILTAHHADDVLETSIMNIRRGTDRYGAAGGMSREGIVRPLLNVRKNELLEYSQEHNLKWREDSTNKDTKYTRNMIRHKIIPKIDVMAYQKLLSHLGELNHKIDALIKVRTSIEGNTVRIQKSFLQQASLREVEVLLAYALRQAQPGIELNQRRVAQVARQIMLGTDKISFSTGRQDCIIIEIR